VNYAQFIPNMKFGSDAYAQAALELWTMI